MKTVRILTNVIEPQPLKFEGNRRFVGRVLEAGQDYELEDDQADKLIQTKRAVPADSDVDAPESDQKEEKETSKKKK
jgi:hypothetical protein